MSFVCCETPATALTFCTSALIDTQIPDTGSIVDGKYISNPVLIDVSRAPYRRVCISVIAPVTLTHGSETAFEARVELTLYREGSAGAIVSRRVTVSLAAGAHSSVTPALVQQVDPGRYNIVLSVFGPVPVSENNPSIVGHINVTASLVTLPL
jgi:hypothetical protein